MRRICVPRLSLPRYLETRRKGTMAPRPHSLCCDEGATLVEGALALTVLIALLFGVFEISMAAYTYHYIFEAAREGARWAIVRGSQSCTNTPNLSDACPSGATESEIADYVEHLGYPGMDPSRMTVTVYTSQYNATTSSWTPCGEMSSGTVCNSPSTVGHVFADSVQVNVSYNFPLSIPFIGVETLPVSSSSTMVYAQ